MWRLALSTLLTFTLLAPPFALAQTDACVALCRIPCVKPISTADRWDDVTGIPGYMGDAAGTRYIDWRNNQHWDREDFFDANGNFLYDPGETYVDGNGNGVYDAELYDPSLTGYIAPSDVGLEIVLHASDPSQVPSSGQYLSLAFPPVNKGTPIMSSDAYRFGWANCETSLIEPGDLFQLFAGGMVGPTNQAMRDLIALDPNASWDDATRQVVGSDFGLSPRVWFVPAHDPRIPLGPSGRVVVRKVLAFFAEQMVGPAEVRGRLLRVQAPGESCGGGSAGGFVVECPVPAPPASWGRVKAAYR